MRRVLVSAVLSCLASLVACGGGSTPTNPTPITPTYPAVAGNYAGLITFGFISLGGSVTCPASTSVTQNGSSVSIAPLTLSGSCVGIPALPLGSFTMDTSGSLGSVTVNNLTVASCNGTYNATASGQFPGALFQFSLLYTGATGGCATQPGNFSITGSLTKQ